MAGDTLWSFYIGARQMLFCERLTSISFACFTIYSGLLPEHAKGRATEDRSSI